MISYEFLCYPMISYDLGKINAHKHRLFCKLWMFGELLDCLTIIEFCAKIRKSKNCEKSMFMFFRSWMISYILWCTVWYSMTSCMKSCMISYDALYDTLWTPMTPSLSCAILLQPESTYRILRPQKKNKVVVVAPNSKSKLRKTANSTGIQTKLVSS